MNIVSRTAEQAIEGQASYGMANLRRQTTGLPFIVFILQKDDARHAARVKVSREPRVRVAEMGAYSISPFAHRAGWRLPGAEEAQLELWVARNRQVLQDYWDGAIEYTEDAIARLIAV